MKKAIMKKWVNALRSGKYRQLKGVLKAKNKSSGETRHCCLGVLCDLYQKEKAGTARRMKVTTYDTTPDKSGDLPRRAIVYRFGSAREMYGLPKCVANWAGIKYEDGALYEPVEFGDSGRDTLAELNDAGCSFKKIADIIEAQADTL